MVSLWVGLDKISPELPFSETWKQENEVGSDSGDSDMTSRQMEND